MLRDFIIEQRSVGMGPAAGANLLSGPRARPRLRRAWVCQMKRPRVQQAVARIRRFGTGELRQWVPVPGFRRSWAGVPKGQIWEEKSTVCLTLPSAKQRPTDIAAYLVQAYAGSLYLCSSRDIVCVHIRSSLLPVRSRAPQRSILALLLHLGRRSLGERHPWFTRYRHNDSATC